jgi:hypothetical protein
MKRYIPAFYIVLIILMISCEKESYVSLGFNSLINNSSGGVLTAAISNTEQKIILKGTIVLTEGELEIILTDSNGVTVFSGTIIAPDELQINKEFAASPGNWKLEYVSNKGVGKIKLHIFK